MMNQQKLIILAGLSAAIIAGVFGIKGFSSASDNAGGVLPKLTQVKIVEDQLVAE